MRFGPMCSVASWSALPLRGNAGDVPGVAGLGGIVVDVRLYRGRGADEQSCGAVLRGAVLWRKGSFGCTSEGGCRFVERILTVVQTLRLQGRPVLTYLQEALCAHRKGVLAPKLLIVG